jgi:superfamily II DNA or RNA helicase
MELDKSVRVVTPTVARISGLTETERQLLGSQLTYTDGKVEYEYKKHKNATWFINKFGYEAWNERLQELAAQVKKCLLFEDSQGLWVYSGLAEKVAGILRCTVTSDVVYPEAEGWALQWVNEPEFQPYAYQSQALEILIEKKHAGVEIGTGLGKSYIIELLVKHFGLRTLIMAPSKDIAKRLYEDCLMLFGPKKVGFYGDGKKVSGKMITIGIAASLTKVEPGSAAWTDMGKAELFIADESHQCAAATLAKVCFGVAAKAPYRFFMSATQMRGDGLDLLLDAITGPIVYTKTVKAGIDEGYLAKLNFIMVHAESSLDYDSGDPNDMTRAHLYYNPQVIQKAAAIVNQACSSGCRVLVLVEELEQFTKLYPYLRASTKFAHGGVNKDNKDKLASEFHDSDPSLFVKEFNDEKFQVLVGTSCITTGTDIKANEMTVNLCGGKSEIQVMQGPSGRSTRLFKFKDGRKKTSCTVVDFDVANVEVTHRHSKGRRIIYNRIYGPIQEVNYGG